MGLVEPKQKSRLGATMYGIYNSDGSIP